MPSAAGIKRLALAVVVVLAAGLLARATFSLLISGESIRDEVKAQIRATTGLDPVSSATRGAGSWTTPTRCRGRDFCRMPG